MEVAPIRESSDYLIKPIIQSLKNIDNFVTFKKSICSK